MMIGEVNERELLAKFRALDPRKKGKIDALDGALKQGLASLLIARTVSDFEYFSALEISKMLEAADISQEPKSITNAFKRAGKRVNVRVEDGETKYKIMLSGQREIEPLLRVGEIGFTFIEAGNRRFAFADIQDIFAPLTNLIKICDPYFGAATIDKLEYFTPPCEVRFLTDSVSGDIPSLKRRLNTGLRPGLTVSVKKVTPSRSLHDRYIISSDNIIFVGHGLKDLGNKDSFIISLPKTFSPDAFNATESMFDSKWSTGSDL